MYIKELRIRNFRSISKAEIPLNNLTLFVGLNDVGKSNVLKALNLFFNDETEAGTPLHFGEDYCKYTPIKKKKAQEIIIELIISPPANYKGGKDIKWTKTWRKNGLQQDDNSILFVDGSSFPERSKLYAWLQNIRYIYVPAVRGTSYFQYLLGRLHDILAETIEIELRDAGETFLKKIKHNTKGITENINQRLKIRSEIRFPPSLQELFKTLDFSTGEGNYNISLINRGDGIKTRHIPIILKFMSEQLNINRAQGSPSVSMIWGYEEPENNLEMTVAFKLAEELIEYSEDVQLLLTTHSAGFYSIKNQQPEKTNLYKVSKPIGGEATIGLISEDSKILDEEMGIMPIIAPYVNEKINEVKGLRKEILEHKKELAKLDKNSLFVEGDDEVRIFQKIINLDKLNAKMIVRRDAFGCSGVKQQTMAFAWLAGIKQMKAVGLFDKDASGKSQKRQTESESQFQSAQSAGFVKCLELAVPSHLINVVRKLNLFPIELEEAYAPQVWLHAHNKGWLEKRSITELQTFVTPDNMEQTYADKINSLNFSDDELLYIHYKVIDDKKARLSEYICSMRKDKFLLSIPAIHTLFQQKIRPFLS